MVKVNSPTRRKYLALSIKRVLGLVSSKEYDNKRMLIVNLNKGESIAYLDSKDNVWELSKNNRGRHNKRKL
jgi:hypothetical protein